MSTSSGGGRAPRPAHRVTTVADLRASLAGRPDVLAGVPQADLERSRAEFAQMPEVAGEPCSSARRSATPGSGR